jgi:pimeloyl-ACP methyl ester carboxylesterase
VPAVFLHGVPDTPQVWDRTLSCLAREDVMCLRLPGFGAPRPADFDATKDAYADWLLETLDRIEGPLDLVGHDWGGILILRALTLAPDFAHSWCVGGCPFDPDYRWHKLARRWQTPVLGELTMLGFTPGMMRRALQAARVPADYAAAAAAEIDAEMKRSVLSLYRSATGISREWAPDAERLPGRGLLLWGALDPYVPPGHGEALAARTGAEFVCFEHCGHWWQCERPSEVAARLTAHWEAAP